MKKRNDMKNNIFRIISGAVCLFWLACGCDFLEPKLSGTYNDENYTDYPQMVRGLVEHAYNLRPRTYASIRFAASDSLADNAVFRSESNANRLFSLGSVTLGNSPFESVWTNNYTAIYYCNQFLKDDLGMSTHYYLDAESDNLLRRCLQGDAYGLRAWYHFSLLKHFGGKGTDGVLYGVPLMTEAVKISEADPAKLTRATFDDTVMQILDDCDKAYEYLPYVNRDYSGNTNTAIPVTGSIRYTTLDQVSIDGLRAMVYLLWASPAFNPSGDKTRYQKAAEYAMKVIRHKLEVEGPMGFDRTKSFSWRDGNSPEAIFPSSTYSTTTYETTFYPIGFGGSADYVPTQELVDAFPMANGYPITDARSGYDPAHPYVGRDSRFYADILYNGAEVLRDGNGSLMYTIESAEGGKDAPLLGNSSPSSYYIKKFLYPGWNPFDSNVLSNVSVVFFERWEQMCLIFAEAASAFLGSAENDSFGYSPKEVLGWVRSRPTVEGKPGITSDPYLDECAASPALFQALVRNEWRITTCFEGTRYFDLRRWGEEINVPVHGMTITPSGEDAFSYQKTLIETKHYPSPWMPIPVGDIRRCPNLVQNEGWENWR